MKILKHTAYYGFGDNIYERPFIVEIAKQFDLVYIQTHFPELYWDQDPNKFKFVKPAERLKLHLQEKNANAFKGYVSWPSGVSNKNAEAFTFRSYQKITETPRYEYYAQLCNNRFGIKKPEFIFPLNKDWIINGFKLVEQFKTTKKICLFKVPSLQFGWQNEARLPDEECMQLLLNRIRKDYFVIGIGNVQPGYEVLPFDYSLDADFTKGQIDIWTIVGSMRFADLCLSSPCYFVPLTLSTNTKSFVVYGGYERPFVHIPKNHDLRNYGYVFPDARADGKQTKIIKNIVGQYEKWANKKGVYSGRGLHDA